MTWERMYVGRIFPGYLFKFALDRIQVHMIVGAARNGDVIYETPDGQLCRIKADMLVWRGGRSGGS